MTRKLAQLALAVLLAACGGAPAGSPGATGGATLGASSPGASASPGAVPTLGAVTTLAPGATATAAPASAAPPPTAGPGGSGIQPGSAIEVTVAELNLREEPSTSATRVEILKRGQLLIVSPYDGIWFGAGPVNRNNYTWYPVMKLQSGANGDLPALPTRPILVGTEVVVGWVAVGNASSSYVKTLPPRCPNTVDLANVSAMLMSERLACLDGTFVLEGTFGCPNCGAELQGDFEPIWLNYPQSLSFLSVDAPEQIGPLILRFPPAITDLPDNGSIIRANVHVDDPAAEGCEITIQNEDPTPPATAELYCRAQIVVESYTTIGTNTDFFD